MPSILKNIFKVIAWIITSVVLLAVVAALLIQIPAVQLRLTQKAVSFIEDKIGTEVSLDGIHIAFPKNIVLEGLYLEDQRGDTLLYAGKLSVNTDLWALTRREVQLNDIILQRSVASVNRAENDSAFNFTYILDAFAGDSTAVPDTLEQKGWNFSLENISMEDIRIRYDDRLQGQRGDLSLGDFRLGMEEFDLENNTYRAGQIVLARTRATFLENKLDTTRAPVEKAKADSTAGVIFGLEQLTLKEVTLRYENSARGQRMELEVGEANVRSETIDLVQQHVDLKSIVLRETALVYHQDSVDAAPPAAGNSGYDSASAPAGKPWRIAVDEIDLSGNSVQYFDLNEPHNTGSVDFDHLWLTDVNVQARQIRYHPQALQGDVQRISFRDHSGFVLTSLAGDVRVTETGATLRNFLVLTGNSRLRMEATARFASLSDIATQYPAVRLSADIKDSYINLRDILYFQPALADSLPLTLPRTTNVNIDAAFRGAVNNLDISHLHMSALSDTHLSMSGRVAGLPELNDLSMDVVLDNFHTTRADLGSILPDTVLPEALQLPPSVDLQAAFRGTPQRASFHGSLSSQAGSINLEGKMNVDSRSALRGLDATLQINDLAVGDILGKPDSVMGKLSMEAKVHSTGLTPAEMTGMFTASIHHFSFQGYDYNNLRMYGSIRDQMLSATASMNDENLDFTLEAGYAFGDAVPRYSIDLDLRNGDFKALNLAQSALRARGNLRIDIATSDFRTLNGNVGIRKVAIFNGDELYAIDSLLFASIDQEGRAEIHIDSDLLEADFEGSINIFGLPGVVKQYVHAYYALDDSLEVNDSDPQHFSFDIKVRNTELLTGLLVPELTSFVPGDIKGVFDSEQQKLELDVGIRDIQYGNITVDSLIFSTRSDKSALHYNLMADKIFVDAMRVDGLQLTGRVAHDSITTALHILDSADRDKYVLAGTLLSREEGVELTLSPEEIILNYQKWQVPPDNYMRFGAGRFTARHVELANRREKIILESRDTTGAPVFLGFRELNLEYLSSMIAGENPLSGLLHGDVYLFPDTTGMTFTSDITVDDFRLRQIPWGDISLKVEQTVKNRFDVDLALSGNLNDVTIQGFYSGGAAASVDLLIKLNRLNLPSLQPLVANQLRELSGLVSGEIQIKGTPEIPDIDGRVTVNDARFLSAYLNNTYTIDEETIFFIDEGISFRDFEIADNRKNKARLDGTILTRTYRDFTFDLTMSTNDFRLLNTTEKDNDLFYGRVDIEALARISGTMTTPVIDMRIGLTEESSLTYVVPQSEASVLQSEGIVKFVDKTFQGDPFMASIGRETADTIKSTFRGIDLTARIELSDQETLTIIIDPVTQDQLSVKGNSTLTLKIDPTGDIQLAGRYEIVEGTYNLSFYKFVKREFSIERGSTITWSGDPLNAEMDIRAIYEVETAPLELFLNQLTGADASQLNQYRQRLPFMVYLNISGQLLQPEIGFELAMPMDERNALGGSVYARLQDINTRESDLNKQVFALLILKRFIADNPFENQSAGGFESTARRSVSKILSEQFNRLSENIKGVELSFDIKSYEEYSSGQAEGQTELQLGVSKSLFDERLVVKLSGNIDIEGQDSNRDATDYIGDLALEYKITPDGRFRITGFRNSNYDMIDGELIETGVGLIYVKDYNSLSELFRANAKTQN